MIGQIHVFKTRKQTDHYRFLYINDYRARKSGHLMINGYTQINTSK